MAVPATATTVDELFHQTSLKLSPIFEQMEWAEEEIQHAQRRHPAQAALLWTTFRLMVPTQDLMRTEFAYRSHCRELLERVARGEDPRPGTSAELALALCHTSLMAPLSITGSGLYLRIWAKAFPDQPVLDGAGERLDHYEALKGSAMDEHEAVMRRKLSQSWRRLDIAPKQTELPL